MIDDAELIAAFPTIRYWLLRNPKVDLELVSWTMFLWEYRFIAAFATDGNIEVKFSYGSFCCIPRVHIPIEDFQQALKVIFTDNKVTGSEFSDTS